MLEKCDRFLLIAEAILIALPITLMAFLWYYMYAHVLFEPAMFAVHRIADIALGMPALMSLLAIFSGWRLFVVFLLGGASRLRRQTWGWWAILAAGVLLLLGSLLSNALPSSPPGSAAASFRNGFDLFLLAAPLLIPLCHLGLERLLRKPPGKGAVSAPAVSAP